MVDTASVDEPVSIRPPTERIVGQNRDNGKGSQERDKLSHAEPLASDEKPLISIYESPVGVAIQG